MSHCVESLPLFHRAEATATFSPDRAHRYTLTRTWGYGGRTVNFLMLNPSTADEVRLDPTCTRCVDFAQSWGYDGLVVTNLFAFRATDPEDMRRAADPVGPGNDAALLQQAKAAQLVVAAWGKHGNYLERGRVVTHRLNEAGVPLHALVINKDGTPKHPLYVKADTLLVRYEPWRKAA